MKNAGLLCQSSTCHVSIPFMCMIYYFAGISSAEKQNSITEILDANGCSTRNLLQSSYDLGLSHRFRSDRELVQFISCITRVGITYSVLVHTDLGTFFYFSDFLFISVQ